LLIAYIPPYICTTFFTHGLIFHPEDGGNIFLLNNGGFLADYTTSHSSKRHSSVTGAIFSDLEEVVY
jgi:hypothetical protein